MLLTVFSISQLEHQHQVRNFFHSKLVCEKISLPHTVSKFLASYFDSFDLTPSTRTQSPSSLLPGKFVFFRKIGKFGKNRINSISFFFFARFEKVRSSSNNSSNFFWRKVRIKFEQSSNELRRNSSNSSIQVSPRCFVFRRCLFMIY
jgi:hypothetical protein